MTLCKKPHDMRRSGHRVLVPLNRQSCKRFGAVDTRGGAAGTRETRSLRAFRVIGIKLYPASESEVFPRNKSST